MGNLTFSRRAAVLGAAAMPMIRVLKGQSKPKSVVISSNNRANGGINCCNKAMEMIKAGKDTLDAVIAGVNIVELDPNDTSVGYGGLPNEDGVVQLDASCVHGPSRRMGAVGAIEGIKTPSKVAQLVMAETDHMMLVGAGRAQICQDLGISGRGSAHRQIAPGVPHVEARDARQEWPHLLGIEHRCTPARRARQGKRKAGENGRAEAGFSGVRRRNPGVGLRGGHPSASRNYQLHRPQ